MTSAHAASQPPAEAPVPGAPRGHTAQPWGRCSPRRAARCRGAPGSSAQQDARTAHMDAGTATRSAIRQGAICAPAADAQSGAACHPELLSPHLFQEGHPRPVALPLVQPCDGHDAADGWKARRANGQRGSSSSAPGCSPPPPAPVLAEGGAAAVRRSQSATAVPLTFTCRRGAARLPPRGASESRAGLRAGAAGSAGCGWVRAHIGSCPRTVCAGVWEGSWQSPPTLLCPGEKRRVFPKRSQRAAGLLGWSNARAAFGQLHL